MRAAQGVVGSGVVGGVVFLEAFGGLEVDGAAAVLAHVVFGGPALVLSERAAGRELVLHLRHQIFLGRECGTRRAIFR